jgi:N-acetylglucosamine-6-phosphate deacetylase
MITVIKNGKIITPYRIIEDATLVIKDGYILDVHEKSMEIGGEGVDIIDANGLYISPGFIDIHTHGGGGFDFMDGRYEDFIGGGLAHLKHGTTTIVPTTLTSSREELIQNIESFKSAQKNSNGPEFLGLHLEGPYFSMEMKGAQDPRYIKNPDSNEYLEILDIGDGAIIRWSVAPELDGALQLGAELRKRNILPSIAHSAAVYEDVHKAFENGYTHVTHFYSAMSMLKRINGYRHLGVVESTYLIDEMTVEIIADGSHLPPELIQLIYKIKGSNHICLVTDSMRGAGMPEGEYILGSLKDGQRVIVEDNVAKLPDRSAFAGSVATSDMLVRVMYKNVQVPLTEAIKMITVTPAKIMGIDNRKGTISKGKEADLVFFDEDINVKKVLVKGKTID